MSVRHLATVVATTAVVTVALAGPAAATTIAADAYELTSGRLLATSAAFLGLIGVIIGGLSLARPGTMARSWVAVAAGLIAVVVGAVVVDTADGGLGTGNGLGGAVVASGVGLLATALGGLAITRARRVG
ncbi:DUF6223 family protein [Nocardia rhizosphaerihabitans]|uniref:DUF6223 family protein n=1 Tax=Nocardia rhizosphaerihabitans TaxID=1691570 RepID=UPI003671AB8C